MLKFVLYIADGRLLSLKEVWENVPDVYHDRLEYEKWTFLTQQVGITLSGWFTQMLSLLLRKTNGAPFTQTMLFFVD